MIKLDVGNVFPSMEPGMALLDPAVAGSGQGDAGLFTQMLEALLADAVEPTISGEPGLDLNGPDRTLLVSGMLSLINPAVGGPGESTVLGEGFGTPDASSISLLEALAALRGVMAQDVITGESGAAEDASMRERLLSPDGLLALAAAGWLTPPVAVPVSAAADDVADLQSPGQKLAVSGAAVAGMTENQAAKATSMPLTAVAVPSQSGDQVAEASRSDSIAQTSLIPNDPVRPSETAVRPADLHREAQPRFQAPVEPLTPAVQPMAASVIDPMAVTQTGDPNGPATSLTPPLTQIVQGVAMLVRKGETQVRLQLHPESLGQVLVQLTLSKGNMSVHLLTDTAAARSIIQNHLADLRTAFANQGLQVDGLSVSVGSDPSAFNAMAQHHHDWSGGKGPAWVSAQPTQDEHSVAPVRNRAAGGARSYLVDYQV